MSLTMNHKDWRDALLRPVWAEVDLDAIEHNIRQIVGLTGPSVRLYAALKGDAYGHGCVQTARTVIASGAYGLALANLYECVRMRNAGITAPMLLYAGTPSYLLAAMVEYNVTPVITDFDSALVFSRCAPDGYGIFIKVDCGLERAGMYAEDARPVVEAIVNLPRIRVEGICTHMHSGSGSATYAHWQFSRFAALVDELESIGIQIPVRLAASSPFVVAYREMHLNAIDPGQIIFGIPLSRRPERALGLKPALRAFKTRIAQIRASRTRALFVDEAPFDAGTASRFGLLPVGWGDGLHRAYGHGGPALVRGKRTSILGPVHYEHCRVDLTGIPEAQEGDEVVLIGSQDDGEILIDEVAQRCGILPTQVTGAVSKHMPVVYFSGGEIRSVVAPSREYQFEAD